MVEHSVGFVASDLLKELALHFVAGHGDDGRSEEERSRRVEVMESLSASAVLFKVAAVLQIECVSMTERGGAGDDGADFKMDEEAAGKMENELILMEIMTRSLGEGKGSTSSTTTATVKEALLRTLDAVGIGLRFLERDCASNRHRVRNALSLNLQILINITSERTVALKPETLRSLFCALGRVHDVDDAESLSARSLIMAVFINCSERSRAFRGCFAEHRVRHLPAFRFLVRSLRRSTAHTVRFEAECESELDVELDAKAPATNQYLGHKLISFYIALLIGFLLQNTLNFKAVAAEMDHDLTPILRALTEYRAFQRNNVRRQTLSSHSLSRRRRSLEVIEKVEQIVRLRMESLRRYQAANKERNAKANEQ